MDLKGSVTKAKNTVSGLFNDGEKLEKAKLLIDYGPKKAAAKFVGLSDAITVQFNPAEYSISRGANMGRNQIWGRDVKTETMPPPTEPKSATLSLTLYFDNITKLEKKSLLDKAKSLGAKKEDKKEPVAVCEDIVQVIKYSAEEHAPPKVRFLWGTLDFDGHITSAQIQYTMFAPDGRPVRATLNLTLEGEEKKAEQKSKQNTFNSPNRTKERMLTEGDQLWMMAQQEYDDPALWKVIAEANGILNPRKLSRAMTLKVPSIK